MIIAQSAKPHTIDEELILPAFKEIRKNVLLHKIPSNIIRKGPLSNNSVPRGVYIMAKDGEISLSDYWKIPPRNEALPLSYVQFTTRVIICKKFGN